MMRKESLQEPFHRFFSRGRLEEGNKVLSNLLLRNTREEVLSVQGECSRGFYNSFLKPFMEDTSATLFIIVGSRITSEDGRERFDPSDLNELRQKSPLLYEYMSEGRVKLFKYPAYPGFHFAVHDRMHVYLQEPHLPGESKDTFAALNNSTLARRYVKRFNEMRDDSTEIVVPQKPSEH